MWRELGGAAAVRRLEPACNYIRRLEEQEEEQFAQNPVPLNSLQENITFDNVRFGYNEDKIIIRDFNAKVDEGQKIAIVGHTGAGKTTMVKLLMRFMT